jgi:hypothetical protein
MRPGTRPAGSTNRRGWPRRWWARSTVGSGGGDGPPHRMGVGHRAEDLPPAPAAIAPQHLNAEHPLE